MDTPHKVRLVLFQFNSTPKQYCLGIMGTLGNQAWQLNTVK